ncbi:hypothetical protein B1729_04870 [Microbacterium sp. B35-04]|uniref:hypothetical protein n=2 Tax=unclassified Microbacterium TaxID=2609290 RepID=UPI0013D69CA5|nr:hypothetical protein [Microbacterium sp. B35-04]KAF2414435.1 hypothetical protein B1729_04870 [Microbacterium sp. B35-04]KAF2419732.1 hypothetical protein B2K11_03990 [Microbacterium sp. B35-30]
MPPMRLLRHHDLVLLGVSPRRLAAALRAGSVVKVRPGVFVRGDAWNAAIPEARSVARAQALTAVSTIPPVVSHETAAAVYGLPLYRAHDRDRVHVIAATGRPGAAAGVIRHRGELPDDHVVELEGMRVTSLMRTVADVARTTTFEQGVTITDAALRQQFVTGPGRYDLEGAEDFRQRVFEIVRRAAHGQTRARRVLEFADGRAQLPGESISRIRLHDLGFRAIQLQVAVAGPRNTTYFVDFGLEDIAALGEFDGAIKYVDGRLLDGRTSSQALDEEKQREDWIRGTTQRRFARWGWPHLRTAAHLGARLEAFGIRPLS